MSNLIPGNCKHLTLEDKLFIENCVKTLYNYIDQGILFSRNIHLKHKVKFQLRKRKNIHNQQICVCRQDLSGFQGKAL